MRISRKCQYALKAVFELAWRNHGQPRSTRDIAEAQRIPLRFAEVILNELKHGGFVESKRGSEGGFILARDPAKLTLLEIIEHIDGPIAIAHDIVNEGAAGNEALGRVWQEVSKAVEGACAGRSFADLVEFERARSEKRALNYII